MTIKEMSDSELKIEYITLFDMIENVQCFGTKDVMRLELIERELDRRGLEPVRVAQVRFQKKGGE